MFKINRRVEYALIALKHMSERVPGELSSAKEISEIYKLPFDVIARVLQILAQHQILKSEQGAQGGYMIQKDLAKVSILKLSEMILGPMEVVKCLHQHEDACDIISTCNIVSPITQLNVRVKGFYDTISVKDLILGTEHRKARGGTQESTSFSV